MPKLRYREDNNTYFIDFLFDGKRVRKSLGRNKKVAALAAKEIEVKLAKQEHGFMVKDRAISSVITEYKEFSRETKSEATYKNDVCARLKAFEKRLENPGIYIRKITSRDIEKYLAQRLKKVKAISVRGDLKTLKAFFNKAISWGYMKDNPCNKVSPPKVEENPPRFLSQEEIDNLLKAAEGSRIHALVGTAVYSGMRRGELIHLEWSDVDFEVKTISVVNKENENFHTKNRKFRVIPLHKKLNPILAAWKEKSLEIQQDKETNYCFPNEEGGLWQNNLRRSFMALLKKAKIENFRFHDLRHTFASQLSKAGVDIYKISKLLGHSSTRTTQIYAHLLPEKIDINKF